MPSSAAVPSRTETELSLLAALLSAESVRSGAASLLAALGPALEGAPAALAVRDRDGLTLHVLAEVGLPSSWPSRLEPQLAVKAQPGVDPATGTMVVPLRANGRVVGALLLADATRALAFLKDAGSTALVDTTAAVLQALAARGDAELRRRADMARSIESVIEGMAHQIANPLTGASAIAQLLVEDLPDDGHRAAVAQIRHELTRAFAVLNDILDFQRDTRAHDGALDLNTLVERIVRFRGYAIREQGIVLHTELAPGFIPVRADARGLEHALLVALRHAELQSSGTVNRSIGVRVDDLGSEVAVVITDSGPGARPELKAGFFDLPLQGLATPAGADRDIDPDLGLVESIVRGCNGRLEVRASKADGTSLVLVLPRAHTHLTSGRMSA